jgi:ABC-type multidrug transport system fused ATPase/permease subunit
MTERIGTLPVAPPKQIRQAWLREARADRRAFATMILLNASAAGAGLVPPWLFGRIIDTVKDHGGSGTVDRLASTIIALAALQLLLVRYASHVGYRFGERTAARLRERFLDRALALPTSFVERAGTGDLTARATTDVGTVTAFLRDAAPNVLIAAVQALLILSAVLVLSPLLGGIGVVGLSGIWFAVRWYLRRARAAYLAQGVASSRVAEMVDATAAGARTIDALGLAEPRRTAAREATDTWYDAADRTLALRTVLFPSLDISYVLPVVGVLVVGGLMINAGSATLGTVVAALLYLRQLSVPLDTILVSAEQLQNSAASFARLEGLAVAPGPRTTTAAQPDGDRIEIADVEFAYEADRNVLRGVTLDIQPGERLAVVGQSGAGKTTLGKLIAGLDVPRTGRVTVGGIPVADLPPAVLREHVALVTQEHHVFRGSLRDNLHIALPGATDTELMDALRAVGATWADVLPDGLDTDLHADGRAPTGPQAQQLALARVLLADPHTVILDEATALLDPTTARTAEASLLAVLKGRTVVAIAHRLHTARDADRIAVMADGQLVEIGSHDALVAAGGTYAALWRSWHPDDKG